MSHPIDSVIVNGVSVDKAALRAEIKKYTRDYGNAAAFRLLSLAGVESAIITDKLYYFDAADLSTADDGSACIHDADGRRFKQATVSATGAGATVYEASSVSGTDTVTCVTDDMPAPSSTATWLMIVFANTNTGAMTLNPDAAGAIGLKDRAGGALAAGAVIAAVPYLIRVTSTECRIYLSGATW